MRVRGCTRGFTLVEVIVIGVIVAILSAMAIKLYSGYIANTRRETVVNLAETAATAAHNYRRKTGSEPPDGASLNLYIPDPSRFSVTINTGAGTLTVTDNDYSVSSTKQFWP